MNAVKAKISRILETIIAILNKALLSVMICLFSFMLSLQTIPRCVVVAYCSHFFTCLNMANCRSYSVFLHTLSKGISFIGKNKVGELLNFVTLAFAYLLVAIVCKVLRI